MKKVYIETMGCQMNKSDAERMFGMLEYLNYIQTDNPKEADMLIINTCSIRQLSEDKAYSAIGFNSSTQVVTLARVSATLGGTGIFIKVPLESTPYPSLRSAVTIL